MFFNCFTLIAVFFTIFKPTFPTRFHNIKSEAEEHPNEEITEEMENQTDWELQVDCISIIRLRACDVENMIISNDDEDMLTNQTQQSNQTGNESIAEHSGTEGTLGSFRMHRSAGIPPRMFLSRSKYPN